MKDNVHYIRRLQLMVKVPYVLPAKSGALEDPSQAVITIDLDFADSNRAIVVQGYYRDKGLMILPYLQRALAKVPRLDRKPLISKEILWDIYESCYFIMRADMYERRTWPEFTRAYAFNQRKQAPKPWCESVFYESTQELIHGPRWQDMLAPPGKGVTRLACR